MCHSTLYVSLKVLYAVVVIRTIRDFSTTWIVNMKVLFVMRLDCTFQTPSNKIESKQVRYVLIFENLCQFALF